jgi:heme exporter protein D
MLDFNAGKYAVFVWPAYGLTVLVLLALIVDSLARARRWRRAVEAEETKASLEGKDQGR